ncbi:MAG: PDZ domain-containing protein [Gemmataceae bacterium]
MLVRMSLLSVFVLGIGLCVHALSAVGGEKPSPSEKQRREEIRKLIEQLSAEQFKVREEATRRLMERDDALPALREAAKSKDAEVRRRAENAIEAISKRLGKRAIQRAIAKLKKGQTDQFVDTVAHSRGYMDEEGWKAALEHAQAIADKAGKLNGCKYASLPKANLARLKIRRADHFKTQKNGFINTEGILAESINTPEGFIFNSLIISDGAVKSRCSLGWSVIFANGNMRIGDRDNVGGIGDSIVVCDGDVDISTLVGNSVILARGNVRVGGFVRSSVIISGGEVKVGVNFPGAFVKNSLIQERQPIPLHFIRFFDPAQEGIEVKTARKEVRVEGITAGKDFGRAGIRRGDRVVAINGTKVDSNNEFRRVLRRQMQTSDPLILDLRREDKSLRIEVCGEAP